MTDRIDIDGGLPPWEVIAEAGGTRSWVLDELRRRELLDEDVDPSRLSAKERKRFRARRDEERRVRRILEQHAWAQYKRAHVVHLGREIYYRDEADRDRFDVAEPETQRERNDLPRIDNAAQLAELLGLSIPRLRQLTFHREVDTGTNYHRWHVPKRNGGVRLISAPKPDLKGAQGWIARNITEHLPVHGAAHGFLPGRSTVTNAAAHAGGAVVVKLDLRDFYPTVTFRRVKGMLRKAGYLEQVATLLGLLCTESPREELLIDRKRCFVALGPRSLPQGAPTSPSLSNAIAWRLDARLSGYARKAGWRYTRYADDLTFSWHDAEQDAPVGALLGSVCRIADGEGFSVRPDKTRVMRVGGRQQVTGLVINPQGEAKVPARVPRAAVRRLRAAIKNRELGRPGEGESIEQLRGMAAYIYMTDPERGRAFLQRIDALEGGA